MGQYFKYPRTYHLPFSEGNTSDDKMLSSAALDAFVGKLIVITEKMDGENTTMYTDHYHARSLDSNNHPSRNYVKGLWGAIKHEIPEGWRICGENLYAQHSIKYDSLPSYFMVFSIWNEKNICLSWQETKEYAAILGLETVPELFVGMYDESLLKNFISNLDLNSQEGIVMRTAGEYEFSEFSSNVAKWVRKNHVQTDEHWTLGPIIPNKLKE